MDHAIHTTRALPRSLSLLLAARRRARRRAAARVAGRRSSRAAEGGRRRRRGRRLDRARGGRRRPRRRSSRRRRSREARNLRAPCAALIGISLFDRSRRSSCGPSWRPSSSSAFSISISACATSAQNRRCRAERIAGFHEPLRHAEPRRRLLVNTWPRTRWAATPSAGTTRSARASTRQVIFAIAPSLRGDQRGTFSDHQDTSARGSVRVSAAAWRARWRERGAKCFFERPCRRR